VPAVSSVSLTVEQGELVTLLGPSGSGKSTILGMIAGLVNPTTGKIWLGDEEVHSRPTYERHLGMVFQSLALFPHMDVFSNIAFPLRMRRRGRREIATAVNQALDIVQLPDIADRRINELSGGQRQRVAIARALVYEPQLLLLDEPFGALDRRLREELQLEIVRLHRELDITIINVTHDQREALMLSDRIAVLQQGVLEQFASSEDIYRRPTSEFVAAFLGDANIVYGRVEGDPSSPTLVTDGQLSIRLAPLDVMPESRVALVIKSEALGVVPPGTGGGEGVDGVVSLRVYEGGAIYYEVDIPDLGARFKVSQTATALRESFAAGTPVRVCWEPSDTCTVPLGVHR